MHENRETSETPAANHAAGRWAKATSRKAYMYVSEESDSGVVPVKRLNNDRTALAEGGEGRPLTKENTHQSSTQLAEGLQSVETQLGPNHVFTGYTLVDYAQHLAERGRTREAKNLKRRGEEILTRHSQENLLGHTFDIQAFQRSRSR